MCRRSKFRNSTIFVCWSGAKSCCSDDNNDHDDDAAQFHNNNFFDIDPKTFLSIQCACVCVCVPYTTATARVLILFEFEVCVCFTIHATPYNQVVVVVRYTAAAPHRSVGDIYCSLLNKWFGATTTRRWLGYANGKLITATHLPQRAWVDGWV